MIDIPMAQYVAALVMITIQMAQWEDDQVMTGILTVLPEVGPVVAREMIVIQMVQLVADQV